MPDVSIPSYSDPCSVKLILVSWFQFQNQGNINQKRREWLPTPVFLSGEFYEQRSLVVCNPWGLKELDTIE